MEFYQQRNLRNGSLLAVGMLILLVTMVYANYLAQKLGEREQLMAEYYRMAQTWLAQNPDMNADATVPMSIIQKFGLPVILEKPDGQLSGVNWGEVQDTSQAFLMQKIAAFNKKGKEPIHGENSATGDRIYLFETQLSAYITYFPIVQFILIVLFVGLGYYLFSTARRAEQNRVWAGMAKETAHQLGTPISAILAWIEFLKEANIDRPDQLEVIGELRSDVTRLELIADRFSKIGSAPELESVNVYTILSEIKDYMQRRAPRKVSFHFPPDSNQQMVKVNDHLFSWVLENLIRNSLDAMDGQGDIHAEVTSDSNWTYIHITDTGKGMPTAMHKEIFKPGVTTKKRGWGLGLSLAKRIIEEYHKGKIFVKRSKVNEGTTFTIQLPAV